MRVRYNANAVPFLEENHDFVLLNPEKYHSNWKEMVFKNNNPCYLEIGCGKGDFIIAMAIKYPMINFIAIEKSPTVLMTAVKKTIALANKLPNLKFISVDASNLLMIFNQKEIQKIFLNFSDPWPKKKHHKRRLTHFNFLKIYEEILEHNGQICLKTDNQSFFHYSYDTSSLLTQWEICDTTPNYFQTQFLTEYEKRFLNAKKDIYYLTIKLKNSF